MWSHSSAVAVRPISTVMTVVGSGRTQTGRSPTDRRRRSASPGISTKETPMRALRTTLAAAWFAGFAPAMTLAADYTVEQLLGLSPRSRGSSTRPRRIAAAIVACKVESIPDGKGGTLGWALRDGQGKLLRRFVNLRGGLKLDQWSYYQDGFEVYREVDLNDDQRLDEARWLNAAGTRVAKVVRRQGRRLEPAVGRGGQQGVRPGARLGRLGPARIRDGDPGRARGAGDSQGPRSTGWPRPRRTGSRRSRRCGQAWSAGIAETVWLGLNAAVPHLIPADAGSRRT